MNKSFVGIILYFATVFPTEYILTEFFGLGGNEDRWIVSLISVPTALTVAISGAFLVHLLEKRKKASEQKQDDSSD